jgi:hypothetical protein
MNNSSKDSCRQNHVTRDIMRFTTVSPLFVVTFLGGRVSGGHRLFPFSTRIGTPRLSFLNRDLIIKSSASQFQHKRVRVRTPEHACAGLCRLISSKGIEEKEGEKDSKNGGDRAIRCNSLSNKRLAM